MSRQRGFSIESALSVGWRGAKSNWFNFIPLMLLQILLFSPFLLLILTGNEERLEEIAEGLSLLGVFSGNFLGTAFSILAAALGTYVSVLMTRLSLAVCDEPDAAARLSFNARWWFGVLFTWTVAFALLQELVGLATTAFGPAFFLVFVMIFLEVKFIFIPFFIIEGERSPWEAARRSWELTDGLFWVLL